jgi:chemotaxis protein MotB
MKRRREKSENNSFWMSTGDLMAGILFIFVLLFVVQLLNVQSELETKEKIIQELATVKNKIIENLSGEFEEDALKVKINPKDGSIELDEKILFDSDKSVLKAEGKKYLKEFIPKYVRLLLGDKEIREAIDVILIEGHTDDVGTYFHNLELSQRRAYSVVDYIFNQMDDFEYKDLLKEYITANGRSFVNLRYNLDGSVDRDKSRRVEFQFKLKNDETLEKVVETLKN